MVDTYLLMRHHKIIDSCVKQDHERMTISKFAGVLAYQLMQLAQGEQIQSSKVSLGSDDMVTPNEKTAQGILKKRKESPISSITFDTNDANVVRFLTDKAGDTHILTKYPKTTDPSGRKRTMCRKCVLCKARGERNDVGTFCLTCGEDVALCNDPKADGSRKCFEKHIMSFKKKSSRLQVQKKVKTQKREENEKNGSCVKLRSRTVRFGPTTVSTRLAVEIRN